MGKRRIVPLALLGALRARKRHRLEDSAVVEQYGTVTYVASHSETQLELAIQYQGDTARGLALFLARTPTEEP